MWKQAWCNGKSVFVNCDGSGNPQLNERQLMTTRYQNKDGAKEYSASPKNVTFEAPPKSKADQLATFETKKPAPGPSRWSKAPPGKQAKTEKPKQPPKKRQRLDEAGTAVAAPLPSEAVFLEQSQRTLASLQTRPIWYTWGEAGIFRVATCNAIGTDWKEHQESTGATASANLSELMAIEKALAFGGSKAVAIVTTNKWAYMVCRRLRQALLPQTQVVAERVRKSLTSSKSEVHWVHATDQIEGVRRCMTTGGAGKKRKAPA